MTSAASMTAREPRHDLLVLAGGRGERLGGVDKAALEVAGVSLLRRVLAGPTRPRRTVVVGPVVLPPDLAADVLVTREDPPSGGPAAGVGAGLSALEPTAEWTAVVAVDQPRAADVVPVLLGCAPSVAPSVDYLCPVDAAGFPQWLLAVFRTSSLRSAVDEHTASERGLHGLSMRRLVGSLTHQVVSVDDACLGDVDTWDDVREWERRLS